MKEVFGGGLSGFAGAQELSADSWLCRGLCDSVT